KRFYAELSSRSSDEEAKELFKTLSLAEEYHKTSLVNFYREISGASPDDRFPESVISTHPAEDVMEGGMKVGRALEWAPSKSLESILELSISLETNSYDLYIKMERRIGDEKAKRVFRVLSEEEKQHLGKLAALLGGKI
ncbi:MAG: ferritin family protein, partial [Nitrospirota bacterium]